MAASFQNDALFELIKSLSKSEKRQFNLYVGRLHGNVDAKFFSLFKFLIRKSLWPMNKKTKNLKGNAF